MYNSTWFENNTIETHKLRIERVNRRIESRELTLVVDANLVIRCVLNVLFLYKTAVMMPMPSY